ncbi:MAG: cobalamin-binding protein [Chloroflexi bacterium]|nr:cobalamin-binding protein [Chloroflexota bacterium]
MKKKSRFYILSILILLLAVLPSACSPKTLSPLAEESAKPANDNIEEGVASSPEFVTLQIEDGLGRIITIETTPQHIISLAPSNTEYLFALGAGDQLVGRDTFSDYPAEAASITDIGGGWGELDIETILTLNVDLVLAADITATEQIQALEDLGFTVFAVANPNNLSEMLETVRMIAQITGHSDEAKTLISELSSRITSIEEKISYAKTTPLVFYELDATDPNAPWTAGPGTFIETLITQAGGTNIGSSLEGAWAQISIEALLVENPDIIILGDFTWGGITPEAVTSRSGWESIIAVQNNKIFTIDDNLISRPSPRMVDGLEILAQQIHPELFE